MIPNQASQDSRMREMREKSFISRISVVANKFNGNSVKMVAFSVFPNNTTGIQKFRSFSKFRGVSKSKLSNHSYLLDYS